jgi:hypothetical protein
MVRKVVPFFALLLSAGMLFAQAEKKPLPSPRGQTSVSFADGKKVTVDYGRPYMRGRKIMGELVPYGKVWRTGANEATSFVTEAPITISGTAVPAGSYTMYTLPGENEWRIIINKQTGQWGTVYNESQDFARIIAKPAKLPSTVDQFTMTLDRRGSNAAVMKIEWENTSVDVDIAEAK